MSTSSNFARAFAYASQARKDQTVESIITATTAYLLACERGSSYHHLEDDPVGCDWENSPHVDIVREMHYAWIELWEAIGYNDDFVKAAWAVWSVLLPVCEDGDSMVN